MSSEKSNFDHQLHNKLRGGFISYLARLATVFKSRDEFSFLTRQATVFEIRDGFISFPVLLATVLFLSTISSSEAQQESPPPPDQFYTARFSSSMAIIIVILIAALFFMGFFSIYIRHCSQSPTGQTIRQTISMRRRGAAAARGLDASVIETFPTFSYAEVKDQRIGKGALECAVCLNEFEDDETLRLIPKCDHVFHPECIDAWLELHVTCPVCRADLAPVQEAAPVEEVVEVAPVLEEQTEGSVQAQTRNDDVSIRVDCEEEEQNARPAANPGLIHSGSLNRAPRSWSIRRPKMFNFGFRSHSTGHSLVVPGENLDRFTLRLPEGVRKEMLNRALLNRNGSCVQRLQRDGSTRVGNRAGGGDGSSRGVRFNNRRLDIPDRAARSDRWAFFTRALSVKSPKVTDNGSTSNSKSPKTAVKMPSFKCLEPKSSDEMETSLVRSDSARPPV